MELSLELKKKLIEEHAHGVPFTLLGKKYHIATSTAANIWRKKEFFLNSKMSGSRKRCNDRSKYKIVNQVTALFVKSMLERNHKIDGEVIKRFARTAAAQCNFKDFHGSNGWLDSFKKRENVCWVRRRGERNPLSVDNQGGPDSGPAPPTCRADSPNLGSAAAAAAMAATAQHQRDRHLHGHSPVELDHWTTAEAPDKHADSCPRCTMAAAAAAIAALNSGDTVHERDHEIEDWFHGIPFLCQFIEEYQNMQQQQQQQRQASQASSSPPSSSASTSSVISAGSGQARPAGQIKSEPCTHNDNPPNCQAAYDDSKSNVVNQTGLRNTCCQSLESSTTAKPRPRQASETDCMVTDGPSATNSGDENANHLAMAGLSDYNSDDQEFYLAGNQSTNFNDNQSDDLLYQDEPNYCCLDHLDQLNNHEPKSRDYQPDLSCGHSSAYEYENISRIRHYPVQPVPQILAAQTPDQFASAIQQQTDAQSAANFCSDTQLGSITSCHMNIATVDKTEPSDFEPIGSGTISLAASNDFRQQESTPINNQSVEMQCSSLVSQHDLDQSVEHADHEEHNLLHNALMRSPEKLKLIDSIITLLNYASNHNQRMLSPLLEVKRSIERDLEVVLTNIDSPMSRQSQQLGLSNHGYY